MMNNSYTTITTAIIYTYYTTYAPSTVTYQVGDEIIKTAGKVTIKDHGMFTFTFTNTMDQSQIARSELLLLKALAAASSVSKASLLSVESKQNATKSRLSEDDTVSSVTGKVAEAEADPTATSAKSSTSAKVSSAVNGAVAMSNGVLGASLAGALAFAACLL